MKKEVDANLDKIHLALGEVAMDCSNYTQAQEDFQAESSNLELAWVAGRCWR